MPVWAAIVIALGSGSVGAWLSGWYQARNDRQERFRERMITAADDFGVAASEGFVALRTALAAVRHDPPPQIQIATDNAWAKRDVLLPLSARLDLLFGPGSEPGLLAAGVTHELAKGCNSLNTDLSGAEQALLDGPEELRKFQRAAFAGIRDPAPRSATVRETVQRALRRG